MYFLFLYKLLATLNSLDFIFPQILIIKKSN